MDGGRTNEFVHEQAQNIAFLLRLVSEQVREMENGQSSGMSERVHRHLLSRVEHDGQQYQQRSREVSKYLERL